MATVTHADVMSLVRQYALARITQNATVPTKRQSRNVTIVALHELECQAVGRLEQAISDALASMSETTRLAAAVEQVRHLNRPMVNRLRACAADTSPNWDGAVTIYPPGARGLVALIDLLLGATTGGVDE